MTAAAEPDYDAYALLSKPTLDLTDTDVAGIVTDLRKRRLMYVQSGKADRVAKPKEPAVKKTSVQKAQASADLLARLKI